MIASEFMELAARGEANPRDWRKFKQAEKNWSRFIWRNIGKRRHNWNAKDMRRIKK